MDAKELHSKAGKALLKLLKWKKGDFPARMAENRLVSELLTQATLQLAFDAAGDFSGFQLEAGDMRACMRVPQTIEFLKRSRWA